MTTTWLTAAEQAAWRSFITTLPDLMAALETDLAPHGLSMGDYEVLVFLSEAVDNRMRMCDLASSLRLSPSGLTRRLDGMVKMGWVDRASCAADRRVMYAHLTAAGRAKMESAAPDHVASVRRHVLEPLGADGVQHLGDLFQSIRDQLLLPT
jgi:DNA-binding MarR family transcriptional regulator